MLKCNWLIEGGEECLDTALDTAFLPVAHMILIKLTLNKKGYQMIEKVNSGLMNLELLRWKINCDSLKLMHVKLVLCFGLSGRQYKIWFPNGCLHDYAHLGSPPVQGRIPTQWWAGKHVRMREMASRMDVKMSHWNERTLRSGMIMLSPSYITLWLSGID